MHSSGGAGGDGRHELALVGGHLGLHSGVAAGIKDLASVHGSNSRGGQLLELLSLQNTKFKGVTFYEEVMKRLGTMPLEYAWPRFQVRSEQKPIIWTCNSIE